MDKKLEDVLSKDVIIKRCLIFSLVFILLWVILFVGKFIFIVGLVIGILVTGILFNDIFNTLEGTANIDIDNLVVKYLDNINSLEDLTMGQDSINFLDGLKNVLTNVDTTIDILGCVGCTLLLVLLIRVIYFIVRHKLDKIKSNIDTDTDGN